MLCPQCGASLPGEETCADRFQTCQLIEIERPEYYAVHHLSVPAYMLQHNAYSAKGWLAVIALLRRFVYEGLSPEAARREARKPADSGNRNWSFTKGDRLDGVENITWSNTIAQLRLDTAEHYCSDVRAWAASILSDSADLVQAAGEKS